MRTLYYCLLIFPSLLAADLSAQYYFSFNPLTESLCPNGEQYQASMDWEVYHSLDNTWFSEPDTSYCFDVLNYSTMSIPSGTYEEGRPIFLRYRGDSLLLLENGLYALHVYDDYYGTSFDLDNNSYCYDGFCQGMMVGIEIPAHPEDSTLSSVMRWHHGPFRDEFGSGQYSIGGQTLCFPTERFEDGNVLREIIFKIIPQEGESISLGSIELIHGYDDLQIPGNGEPYFWENQGELQMGYEGPAGTLVLHTDTAYPDAQHQSYFDFLPNPNTDTVSDLQLYLYEGSSLIYQPFSNLRGGLVEGSDSLRHNLSYINDGGGICFVMYIDVIINASEFYEHRSGDLSFLGTDACMQFRPYSKLIVAQEAQMEVGHDPTGILLLCNDTEIELRRHASLIVNNKLTLDYRDEGEDKNVHVNLNPTTSLAFGAGAQVRDWSDGMTQLHIRLRGGHLDVSNLSSESMENIVIHHEEPVFEHYEISILGNPVVQELLFGWESEENALTVIKIRSSDGRIVKEWQIEAARGLNYESEDLSGFPSGLYVLEVRSTQEKRAAPFVIQ